MECSCGSAIFTEHKVQRDKKVIAVYVQCKSCGRVLWMWGKDNVAKEFDSSTVLL
jgi:hypothetical protein